MEIREEINIQIRNRISTPISIIKWTQFNAICLVNRHATTVMFRLMSYWQYRKMFVIRLYGLQSPFNGRRFFTSSRLGMQTHVAYILFSREFEITHPVFCVCLHPVIMHFVCCLIKSPLFDFQHKPCLMFLPVIAQWANITFRLHKR